MHFYKPDSPWLVKYDARISSTSFAARAVFGQLFGVPGTLCSSCSGDILLWVGVLALILAMEATATFLGATSISGTAMGFGDSHSHLLLQGEASFHQCAQSQGTVSIRETPISSKWRN